MTGSCPIRWSLPSPVPADLDRPQTRKGRTHGCPGGAANSAHSGILPIPASGQTMGVAPEGVPMSPSEGPMRHAEAAHSLQPKSLRLSRRLPAASCVVQARVRPAVGGDCPPPRDLTHDHTALVEGRHPAELPASECVAEPGRRPGSCPPVQRVRKRPATAGP